jgi:NAD(P)-dependent dehydrogenase (short-subunit alcohol dehydrogenase family)
VINKKVWFITGAGRGMGGDFAKAALAAGHAVVATGRSSDAVSKALGKSNDLLAVTVDVTKPADAQAAVRAAVDRFGRIDVLVNKCGQLLRRLLRGADLRAVRPAVVGQPDRPDERHPSGAAGDAQAAFGTHYFDLIVGRPRRRLRLRVRLRRVQVRPRGLDGVAPG